MPKPFKLQISSNRINAFEYMLHLVQGCLDAGCWDDADANIARKLSKRILTRVEKYIRKNNITPTPQPHIGEII